MNKTNYDRVMVDIISELKEKPKLLLHSCCAPCSTACIDRLRDYFDLTVFYYNPNIDTAEEYDKRVKEQIKYCNETGVKFLINDYDNQDFFEAVQGYEKEKEGGKRCEKCFMLRLQKTAQTATKNGFDYFCTTLTVSPLKNADLINKIGLSLESEKVKYLPSDFKKQGGYLRSVQISKEKQMYRQNYCGCVYSKVKEKP